MLKCTINGKEISVAEGKTIIEAYKENNIDIAYYCWHPGLSVAGVCRLCLVEIEGNPKLQIACNTKVQEGMNVNNTSEKVREAVKWGLDFHLINHPLDCPICDQAGECGLQDQYMQFGQYDSQMNEKKVRKSKVVDLGKRVVLDSERCILCSRCVRFTEEVTKTNELGIFQRGDHSEIGTFEQQPLSNNYSLNTVDICPVGALTSKDFRFRQRVWFLKNKQTICQGCATGCNVQIYYNNSGVYRLKPVHNPQVNGWWMCDEGRDSYKFINAEARLGKAFVRREASWEVTCNVSAVEEIQRLLKMAIKRDGKNSVALVLTGQYSNEEYIETLAQFTTHFNSKHIYYWINNPESFDDFDGLLLRGDRNPNTKGLINNLDRFKLQSTWNDLTHSIGSGEIKTVIVAGPENQSVYPDMKEKIYQLARADRLIWLSACKNEHFDLLAYKPLSGVDENGKAFGSVYLIPMKSYIEKSGSYINYMGLEQKVERVTQIIPKAFSLDQAMDLFVGKPIKEDTVYFNESVVRNESMVNNEFVYKPGQIGKPMV